MSLTATRSSYLATVLHLPKDDTETFTNRGRMNEFFREDIYRNQHLNSLEAVDPRSEPKDAGCTRALRLATWNINLLCGLASSSWVTKHGEKILAEQAATIAQAIDADVLILQEAMNEPDDKKDPLLHEACARVRDLDELLQNKMGYKLFRSQGDGHGNHVVLATRVAPALVESVVLDTGEWPALILNDGKPELPVRVAVYAELQIGTLTVGIYGLHLHHKNSLKGFSEENVDGLRAAEIETLLADIRKRSADAYLIGGDFNQARRKDYTAEERLVVERTLERFGSADDNDGVADCLQAQGFLPCWDEPALRNFLQEAVGESSVGAPPFTHWTGLPLDYVYLGPRGAPLRLVGAHVWYTDLSDHLPVVVDVAV